MVASKSTFRLNFHGKVCCTDALEEVWSGCFDGGLHVIDFGGSEEVPSFEGGESTVISTFFFFFHDVIAAPPCDHDAARSGKSPFRFTIEAG